MADAGVDSTLRAIRAGDQAAFERLFREWYPRLASYAKTILGSPEAAEDVVQEMFIALWERREKLPDVSQLAGYLHRAVRNRALNQIRGARTAERAVTNLDTARMVAPIGQSILEAEELEHSLQAALDQVAPRGREVFLLSRRQGLTYPQIAETLEISVKTVETLMGRTLKALRDQLSAK